MTNNKKLTATFIKSQRKKMGLSQEKFANIFQIGRSALSRYESAKIEPGGSLILRIQALDERQINQES